MVNRIFLFVILFFYIQITFSQNNNNTSRLSPLTRKFLSESEKNIDKSNYIFKKINGKNYLSALIKVSDNTDISRLSKLDILIGTKAGNIWTVQIPPENLEAFASIKEIEYIQLDEPVFINLDSARHDTHTDSVHQGIQLPQAYTGKNVVVGIIDAGFDYTHPAFLDTSGNNYRIKKVWELKETGTPPSGYTYGNEITDSAALFNDGYDVNTFSHGSHVAGIAAGSGYGSSSDNKKYRGIAFESDLIFVGIRPEQSEWTNTGASSIIDGINYIFDYAESVGKPAVANLSWGCTVGPHDGTSLFSQAVDNLTGEGKIFVCAAGNNGATNIHLGKKFSANDTLLKTVVSFSTYMSAKKTWVDAWGDASENFCSKLTLCNGATPVDSTEFICLDNNIHNIILKASTGDTCFATITTSASDFNGKPRIFFDFFNKSANRILITIKANSGTVNMWMGYVLDYTGYYGNFIAGGITGSENGNKDMTISDFASTHSAISAAAYVSKVKFTNIDGQINTYTGYTEGNITSFSSHGPAADSLTKPDIAAPGMTIASSINSFDTNYDAGGTDRVYVVTCYNDTVNSHNYCYAVMSGTSMASPMTSGIIALMLEANPSLTPGLVKYILQSTAITDSYTGVIPSEGSSIWGYGKINAYAAVKKSWTDVNVNNISNTELNYMIYPNPNNGNFSIDYISKTDEEINISIIDILGKNILSENWKVNTGINSERFNFSDVTTGIYFIKISSLEGTSVYKMIVK
ncbi:MAG TPA: S8/S53 family peptidase [Bacteroidales bacterium]|nr:S8/S53 family peptidase [Bacteroidales bacterium]HPS17575.1 S8/S53 family peptidase [Bacteroidales bacterium]